MPDVVVATTQGRVRGRADDGVATARSSELALGGAAVEGTRAAIRGFLGADAERVVAAYTDARADRSVDRAWIDILGDVSFRIPMIRLAEAQAGRDLPVWMYRFDYASKAFGGRLGAAHAIELPFVWDRLDLPFTQILLGDVADARPLATAMHDTWAAFVRDGEPAGAGLPSWPTYQVPRRATMLLDVAPRVADDPGGALRALWP
ncbi:MAG TPA: carboxylesterase family protein [Kofleriaceae bacterium]|nr:carboxylesterase family protein [Kofleriaceae bacterium]